MKTKDDNNIYPLVLWAEVVEVLPFRAGRSVGCGYSDDYFWKTLNDGDLGVQIHRNCQLEVPCRAIPYAASIALVDEHSGVYVDVEIDAPYHGWYRVPMHYVDGKDEVRDRYFNEQGWTVVRFSERQVREQTQACVELLRRVIAAIRGEQFEYDGLVRPEKRWTQKEAVAMERELVREKYLSIQTFGQPEFLPQIRQQVKAMVPAVAEHPEIVFNEEMHTYADARNTTGTADYVSVTTLIEKFFPYFDEEAYIQKFMAESGKTREEVVRKMLEPSERGTDMHQQIEYFLKGNPHREDFKEFQLFRQFHQEQIQRRGLTFFDAEKVVTMPQFGIAGTVDALFRKPDGTFVMVDWKRSKHLIIDGYPKKYGIGRGLSILSHLDNSSYYHYELQQSFYKYILENEYGMKVSSMILCVLHPDYDRYYTIKLADYRVEEVREMIAAHLAISY